MTFVKLTPTNQCDHCFKVSDDVHRYKKSCKLKEESRNDIYKFFHLQVQQVFDQGLVQQGVPEAGMGGRPQEVLLKGGGGEEEERQHRGEMGGGGQ